MTAMGELRLASAKTLLLLCSSLGQSKVCVTTNGVQRFSRTAPAVRFFVAREVPNGSRF